VPAHFRENDCRRGEHRQSDDVEYAQVRVLGTPEHEEHAAEICGDQQRDGTEIGKQRQHSSHFLPVQQNQRREEETEHPDAVRADARRPDGDVHTAGEKPIAGDGDGLAGPNRTGYTGHDADIGRADHRPMGLYEIRQAQNPKRHQNDKRVAGVAGTFFLSCLGRIGVLNHGRTFPTRKSTMIPANRV